MQNILEFVMRSRWTAALTVFALSALSLAPVLQFPATLLALALVTLVCLSRGPAEGALVALWAALPVMAAALSGVDTGARLQLLNLVPLPWTLVCALCLHRTSSWTWTLIANTVCALLCALALQWFAGDFLERLTGELRQTLEQILDDDENVQQGLEMLTGQRYAVMYSNGIALLTLLCLILGRYWQAMLYNPGGLRRELHRLRLPLPLALTLIGLWFALWLLASYDILGYDWRGYDGIIKLPLLVAGLALAHALAVRWNAGFWLIFLYVMLLLVPQLRSLLMLAAVIDSQADFRSESGAFPPSPPSGRDDDDRDPMQPRRDPEEQKEG